MVKSFYKICCNTLFNQSSLEAIKAIVLLSFLPYIIRVEEQYKYSMVGGVSMLDFVQIRDAEIQIRDTEI